jgi:hypothetical protein
MHIILGILGTIVTILWLLHRLAEMGVTLGGLNPFLWNRRRKWTKYHDANPIYKVDSPMDVTALLMTAVAKADGDMSSEEKQALLSMFQNEFNLDKKESAALLVASSHLLGKGDEVRDNLKGVLKPSQESFTAEQAQSAIDLLNKIAGVTGSPSHAQTQLVNGVSAILEKIGAPKGKWE